jgi:hypothetical protein
LSEQIKVGDLACVVRAAPCCGSSVAIGTIFRVSEVANEDGACGTCGAASVDVQAYETDQYAYLVTRLKRIPPLEELEGEKRDENLKEPA